MASAYTSCTDYDFWILEWTLLLLERKVSIHTVAQVRYI